MKKWLELVRFSHTIFALPFALASLVVAAEGIPSFLFLFKILLCMVTARNAAMAFNRLIDADIDAKNPRTQMRHLVSGALNKKSVIFFILINAILFVIGSLWINNLCFYLSIPVLLLLLSYSLFKRFSWLCHVFLGLAIGLSPVAVWIAVREEVSAFSILLGLILMTWIAGFDIIYATQDREADESLGLHSIPVRFGEKGALKLSFAFHILMLICVFLVPFFSSFGTIWWGCAGLLTALIAFIHYGTSSRSLDQMNESFFFANSVISVFILIACVGEVWLAF